MNKQLLLAAILIAPFYSHADDCRYSKDYDFSADAASLESLRLDVGAGKLIVTGNSARNEVSVVATACANTSERLEELDLNHRARDSELLVRTERHRSRSFLSWLSFGNNYSHINVEVTMPSDLALDVDDGSGSVEISNVSSLSLKDGSGSILIDNISGDVDVDDGSGSIYIFGVSGIVSIEDGSGPIRIRDSNEVAIIDDGSGDISIENIHSNVNIRHDGSGGIRIRDVAGDVEIGDAGSGSVDVSGVAGVYNFRDN
jgi:DUF4097 and DUF4098 domain-containing protein YvlB